MANTHFFCEYFREKEYLLLLRLLRTLVIWCNNDKSLEQSITLIAAAAAAAAAAEAVALSVCSIFFPTNALCCCFTSFFYMFHVK